MSEPTAPEAVLAGDFWDLGDLADVSVGFHDAAIAVEMVPATINVPQVRGMPVGDLADQTRVIKMIQLELADVSDLLYPNFNYDQPETDPNFAAYCEAIEQRGTRLDPLHVLPINKVVTFQGQELPMFAVYDDPIQFVAMRHNRRGEAKIIIELGVHPGALLMQALSRTQHLYRPSVLDLCDVASRLAGYGYDQDLIAVHMAKDSDTNTRVKQGTVSRMIAVAKLPHEVRQMMVMGNRSLTRSHAELLAVDRFMPYPDQQITLARWVMQPPQQTVKDLEVAINLCYPKVGKALGHFEIHKNGFIELIDDNVALELVSDQRKPVAATYPLMTELAQPGEIVAAARTTYKGARVESDEAGHVYVAPTSFSGIEAWAREAKRRDEPVSIHEAEVMVYAWLEALRTDAQRKNLLTRGGRIPCPALTTTIVDG